MQRSDFNYPLPEELIAQHPCANRRDSRLLCLDGRDGTFRDSQFKDIGENLKAGDLLVFNDTKVMPARMYGNKSSGGRIELLVERLLGQHRCLAHIKASKSPKPGSKLDLEGGIRASVIRRHEALYELQFESSQPLVDLLEAHGHIPLPPYIKRQDGASDHSRYQTVYASKSGAVAAPTAGLHFDQALLDELDQQGVGKAFVTLHVGAGTFQPVRVDNLEAHQMHSEFMEISESVCDRILQTRERGGRVVAVGTTSVRCLETAAKSGQIKPYCGETNIFLKPGSVFNCVDAMVTNFHLPESTLLMLVSAFSGYDNIMNAYKHAVKQKYRFFSYGDAMWLTRNIQ